VSNDEQQLFLLTLKAVEISLNELEWKARAVEKALQKHPALYADYQKLLEAARKEKITVVAETVATLRRELDQNKGE
jgi:hypothetical protein